jgi:hypothetical protein
MNAGKTDGPQNDGAPKLPYWHLWTDDEGISWQTRCALTAFENASIGPGEFACGGDQNCVADSEGRFGHLSGQFGDEPWVQLIVQRNNNAWVALRPGAFK